MSEPLRVAVIDEELPFPPNSGKRLRTSNLLTRLASKHRITLIAYNNRNENEQREAEDYYRGLGINVALLGDFVPEKRGPGFYARLIGNLLSPLPYSVQSHNRRSLRDFVRKNTGTGRFDLWHCEWTPLAECCLGIVREPWLIMAHNVESLIWRRMAESEQSSWKRWYIRQQYLKYDRFEKKAYSRTPQLVTVSEDDARLAERDYGARAVQVVENGVDAGYFQRNPRVPGDPHADREARHLLFLGSLDWRPNIDAVELLLDRVFPAIRHRVPNAALSIVGRRPTEQLVERVKTVEGVELYADVPDVRPFLWKSAFLIVPLRIGGGSRLKILESLAAACPVVSTVIGAEGLQLEHERDLLLGSTSETLIEQAVRALEDPDMMRRLGDTGRETVLMRYGWDGLAGKLDALWKNVAAFRD